MMGFLDAFLDWGWLWFALGLFGCVTIVIIFNDD